MNLPSPISWTERGTLRLLDQTSLPREERYLELSSVEEVAQAIERLSVRGAPLIGIAAAFGVVLAVIEEEAPSLETVIAACRRLKATRPTAVNLAWALDRMEARARGADGTGLGEALLREAEAIWEEDKVMCRQIGEAGSRLVPDQATVMTQCNAGILATGGIGTALAPIYLAAEQGKTVEVVVPETRPLLQGSRLTAWELTRSGIPCTLITDNMVAVRLAQGDVSLIIVGADRVAANGDAANKIGTYALALAAQAHDVPLYVAFPGTTLDLNAATGADIPIERRRAAEVTHLAGQSTAPEGVRVWNPAFDVTPARLIAGYITDGGVLSAAELGGLASAAPRTTG